MSTAWDLWQAGQLDAARAAYAAELACAGPDHWARAHKLGECAVLLNQLGQHDQARVCLEEALAVELERAEGAETEGVRTARYCLAEQMLKLDKPAVALGLVQPALACVPEDCLLRAILARAQQALGWLEAARASAAVALRDARNPRQREVLRGQLAGLA
ncbi:hypothetical protein [Massilia sp. TS11]|uniref:hypothetical protein n=1 Tax=Massilia sp. TS11 TaxID=2908003 RepID=UPI001EDBF028|nr:hypothetical protein [Massilia sp. TS11]MCG2582898.1 hypothetical protein [Massilia sp. TS11]